MLQEAGVAVIVLAAVVFLVRQFYRRLPQAQEGEHLHPAHKLKKRPDDNCH